LAPLSLASSPTSGAT